jgi:hypothetical protein
MPAVLIDGQIKGKASGIIDIYVFNLCKSLGISRMRSKLIQIYFVSDQEGQLGNAWGCSKEGYAEINIARKSQGTKVSYKEMMQTLAHEMVHVKQYFRNELDGTGMKFKWKGRNANGYQYENQPWEREAFKREEVLYNECWPTELEKECKLI